MEPDSDRLCRKQLYINGKIETVQQADARQLRPLNAGLGIRMLSIENGRQSKNAASNNSDMKNMVYQDITLLNRCLSTEEIRSFRTDGSLPEDVEKSWEISFNKGKPSSKKTNFKKSTGIIYKKLITK